MKLSHVSSLAVAALASAALSAQCQINPNVGTNLGLTDDSVSAQQALGFNFSFAGSTYDSVYVSSNGFLYLFNTAGSVTPPTNSRCCTPVVANMLAETRPMVCGLWMDLNPTAGGTVNFNALPNKALITWLAVPEFGQTNVNSFQIALNSNGTIEMVFDANCDNIGHTTLTGWSPGNGATDPGSSNLSNLPITPGSATVYELFNAATFDLSGGIVGTPNGPSAWVVSGAAGCARTSVVGKGCPKPCTFYEEFANSTHDLSTSAILFTAQGNGSYRAASCNNCFDSNFTNALTLTDDSLAVGQALGFTFPWCGGSTTSIDVCSNGFVWLVSGSTTSTDFSPTGTEFVSNPARIAATWMDLNPTAGGTVYFDALPNKALVTWSNVVAFGTTGTSNTFQLQLFPNGDFILAFGAVLNNQTTGNGVAIVGLTPGGVGDPGSMDLSASLPFRTGFSEPATLAAQGSSLPVIGTTFTMDAGNVRPSTVGGTLILSATNPNLDLGIIGLTGCTLLANLDVTLAIPATSPVTSIPLAIPNSNALIGRTLSTQVVFIDPTIGYPIPVYLTNGLGVTMGL